jgi:ABC-2 type transport system ATP-binding protein
MLVNWQATESGPEARKQLAVAGLRSISKNYGDVAALRNVSFDIQPGELVALLGPNGAGKTTAIKLLLGLASPTTGAARIFGGDPRDAQTRTRIGAMLQVAAVPATLRIREHIDLFSSYYPNPLLLSTTLAIAGLEDIQDRRFGDLSGGQKQRVLFALAVCGNADLLFLDEPTVGLDVEARRMLWEQIRKLIALGKTVLLTTHYLEEADALADRILVLNHGQIVAEGTPAKIKTQTAGKKIRCVSSLSPALVNQLPGVLDVVLDREGLEIRTSQAESVVRELLSRDPGLHSLEISSAGLEEAFLALTRNEHQTAHA